MLRSSSTRSLSPGFSRQRKMSFRTRVTIASVNVFAESLASMQEALRIELSSY
jgi:hypothetical protein